MKCVIIEDEPLAANRLKDYISRCEDLILDKWFEDGLEAAEYLSRNSVDLIFLDLHLGETSGIQLMEKGLLKGKVIVTTAYAQYALKGYDLDVVDYLMKPFVFERFEEAVRKASRKSAGEEAFVMIRSEYKLEKIFVRDIIYIEGMGDYRRLHTTRGRIMTLQTFKELENMIPNHLMKRIHKSYMVNVRNIEKQTSDEIILSNKVKLPVSETYRKQL